MKKFVLIISLCLFFMNGHSDAFEVVAEHDPYARARQRMIENDLKARDISSPEVLQAMQKVPRHLFVEKNQRKYAYNDYPLPIEEGQTISQPYIVALMTQSLRLKPGDKVLEIGTGSGYQAAVLAEIVSQVFSIEIVEKLAKKASMLLQSLGYQNIKVKSGDGFAGWEEHAPFDAIIVTCAARQIPPPLIKQLKQGGRIILPLGGNSFQDLVLGVKKGNDLALQSITGVRFVPMVGEVQKE